MTTTPLRCARPSRLFSRPAAAGIATALALVASALSARPALAQYQWVDPAGQMVYSDLPPPPGTDPSKVIRRPQAPGMVVSGKGAGATAGAEAGNPPTKPAMASLADRELAFKKRMQERADAEKKRAEEGIEKAKTARACADARSSLRQLESGMPITRVREDGQREVLDDTERATRIQSIRQDVSGRC